MRIAVITPTYQVPRVWLDACLASVGRQTIPCTHFLVSDGDAALDGLELNNVEYLRLSRPHHDHGNAARAIGSVSAIARGFDAIAYLDADNWYEADHLQQMADIHQRTGAAVCTSSRDLMDLDGQFMGRCPEVDGEKFVDTNCLFLTAAAFGVVEIWFRLPHALSPIADRMVWQAIKDQELPRVHRLASTVKYRTSYLAHYKRFGRKPRAQQKHPH